MKEKTRWMSKGDVDKKKEEEKKKEVQAIVAKKVKHVL